MFKKFIFLTGYLFSTGLSALLLAEAVLWIWLPLSEDSLFLSQKVKLNVPGLKSEITITRNQYGFRSLSMRTKEKGPGTIRVICLGASTTEQAAQNTKDTWSGILDRKLNEAMSKKNIRAEVAAWGYGGTKVWDGYAYCERKLLEYQPDIVITLWGINDLLINGGPNYSYGGKEKRMTDLRNLLIKKESEKNGRRARLKTIASKYSQIYRRLILI